MPRSTANSTSNRRNDSTEYSRSRLGPPSSGRHLPDATAAEAFGCRSAERRSSMVECESKPSVTLAFRHQNTFPRHRPLWMPLGSERRWGTKNGRPLRCASKRPWRHDDLGVAYAHRVGRIGHEIHEDRVQNPEAATLIATMHSRSTLARISVFVERSHALVDRRASSSVAADMRCDSRIRSPPRVARCLPRDTRRKVVLPCDFRSFL